MKMFVEPSAVFLHRDFIDFRKAINGLAALVEDELNRDVYSGALFVFCNKAKDKLKILYWDKTGFALWQKRLEKQKFKWLSKVNGNEFAYGRATRLFTLPYAFSKRSLFMSNSR